MSTNENISAYYDDGPPNYDLIADYLQQPRPRELALLAASLAIKDSNFDPESLVKMAADLRLQAQHTFIARQAELLSKMNCNTLKTIHFHIHGDKDHDFRALEHKDRLHHAIAGPLARQIQAGGDNWATHMLRLSQLEADVVLRQVEERTQMDRPNLPCSLEDALLWITSEPRKSRDVVVLAHQSFLASEFAKSAENHLWRTIEVDKWQIVRQEEALDEIEFQESEDEERNDIIRQLQNQIDHDQENIALRCKEANEVGAYIKKPSPSSIPAVIIEYAIQLLLQENNSIKDNLELAKIAKGFHEFWQACSRNQLKAFLKGKKKAKNKDEVKKTNGEKGIKKRERRKWQGVTYEFCKYLSEHPTLFACAEDLHVAINDFMSGESKPRRVSKTLAIDFLGTLWNAARTPAKADEIIQNQLQCDGFKFVDKEFMREMLALTSEVFQQPNNPGGKMRNPQRIRQKAKSISANQNHRPAARAAS